MLLKSITKLIRPEELNRTAFWPKKQSRKTINHMVAIALAALSSFCDYLTGLQDRGA